MTERPPKESFRHRYRERRVATERKGAMGPGRVARTVVLAIMALAAIMFYAVREMGVDLAELRDYALVSLLFVGAVIVSGAIFGALIALLRSRR